jgi:glycosyltransferase involved in cell wall biosynthesis
MWLWGAFLPLFVIVTGLRWPLAAFLAVLGYFALFGRIAWRLYRRGMNVSDAALYAAGRVVGKFPQMHGVSSFLWEQKRVVPEDRLDGASSQSALRSARVTYLVNQYPKVTHTFVRTEIAAVERAGVQVDRVAIRHSDSPLVDPVDREEAARTRVLLDGGVLTLIAALARTASCSPRRFARALRTALRIGWRSERGVGLHLAYLAEACLLLRWIGAQRSSHVHATFGSHTATIALLCRVMGGPPYSFTAHGPEEFERADLLSIAEKTRHAAFVAVVSEAGRTHLRQLCPPSTWERIHLVRCGIDARFATHPPTPIPSARRMVFVGRLCAEKAPLLLVEAMAQLNVAGEACELVMVGDGPLRTSVESRIRALHLADRITLVGWASNDDVKRHILASRALVLPSFAEGLPIVLMEALALLRPVICTAVGGVAELVEPGVCGWLIPPGSVEALVQAMGNMLHAPPSELERMGRQGAARVARQHDPAVAGRTLAALFARSAPAGGALPLHRSTSSFVKST